MCQGFASWGPFLRFVAIRFLAVPLLANIFLVLHFKLAIIKMADNSFGCKPKVKHTGPSKRTHGYGYAWELSGACPFGAMNLSFFQPISELFLHRVLTLLRRQLSTCEWLRLSEEALQGQLHFVWPATPPPCLPCQFLVDHKTW